MTFAQKDGAMHEDDAAVKAVIEEVADAEDDAVKPSWTRRAPGLPRLEMCHRRMHVSVLLVSQY